MYSLQDLNDLFSFYSNLDLEHDGFVMTRIALRDEILSRGDDQIEQSAMKNIV